MYALHQQGTTANAAAKSAVAQMGLKPVEASRAIERVRKKFSEYLEKKEKEKTSQSANSTPRSEANELVQGAEHARQAVKFVGASGIKAVQEQQRLLREDKTYRSLLLEGLAKARRLPKR